MLSRFVLAAARPSTSPVARSFAKLSPPQSAAVESIQRTVQQNADRIREELIRMGVDPAEMSRGNLKHFVAGSAGGSTGAGFLAPKEVSFWKKHEFKLYTVLLSTALLTLGFRLLNTREQLVDAERRAEAAERNLADHRVQSDGLVRTEIEEWAHTNSVAVVAVAGGAGAGSDGSVTSSPLTSAHIDDLVRRISIVATSTLSSAGHSATTAQPSNTSGSGSVVVAVPVSKKGPTVW